jgi:heme exporter protein D
MGTAGIILWLAIVVAMIALYRQVAAVNDRLDTVVDVLDRLERIEQQREAGLDAAELRLTPEMRC